MKFSLTIALFCFFTVSAFAQPFTISGKITDGNNRPIPFASIYVKNTTKGTSANSEGEYSLQLSSGTYDIQYKAVGYKQLSKRIDLNQNQTLNITLATETFQLNDVVIKAGGEDPAYAIIRKAIKKRKTHLNEVDAFSCEVYIKGLQKLLAAPKKIFGFDVQKATNEMGLDSNRRGIVYLSESESKYTFKRPNQVHEEMISSKVSGDNKAFSYNRASDMKVNFYENMQTWEGLSLRPVISPVADNALFYYNYKYIGFTTENGETVDKIQVLPKRQHDACFQGYIYILENDWRIYSLDLFITKKQNINFVDTLKISQQFIPVNQQAWMPSNLKFEFTAGLFGFKVGGYFISVFKDYDLNPTLNKKQFAEVLKVTSQSNKKDSAYWATERPIPLTEEEKTDYLKKEVLARKRESKPYLDSLDRVNNKFDPVKLLYQSYRHTNRYKHEYYNFDPLLTSVRFNTVQGFNLNYGASFTKRVDSVNNRYLVVGAHAGYGFSDHVITGGAYTFIPAGSTTIGLSVGSDITDLSNRPQGSLSSLFHTFHNLFERENFEKLYQKQYVSVSASRRITGGWMASAYAEWAYRRSLENSTSFSFFSPSNHEYTSNNPFTPNQNTPLFADNQSFKVAVRTTYDFSDKYETLPGGRRYLPSKYPTIGINYTKGIKGVLGSDVDYDLLSADISKLNINAGVFGFTSFYIGAGKFLNNNSVYFPDYKHFAGSQTLFTTVGINSFLMLNYYNYSTDTQYIEGHLEQNFSGFFLNKIPLIRKLKLQEIVDINYLSTPSIKNYTEVGVGVQYLAFRLMVGKSFNSGTNAPHAIRIGLIF